MYTVHIVGGGDEASGWDLGNHMYSLLVEIHYPLKITILKALNFFFKSWPSLSHILLTLPMHRQFVINLQKVLESHLSTDSTKTRRALTWIQAVNASLKFTFNHRTRGPYYNEKMKCVKPKNGGNFQLITAHDPFQ